MDLQNIREMLLLITLSFFCCYACVTAGHATRDLCFQNYFTGVYKFPWAQQIQISTQSDLNGSSRHPSKVATPSSFLSCCYGRDRTRNAIGNNTFEPSFSKLFDDRIAVFLGHNISKIFSTEVEIDI